MIMKKVKKNASLAKLGAVPLQNFSPFDHNEPGTPVAIRLTPTPIPPATTTGKLTKGNTATTDYGRDSGDKKKLKRSKETKEHHSSGAETQNSTSVESSSKAESKKNNSTAENKNSSSIENTQNSTGVETKKNSGSVENKKSKSSTETKKNSSSATNTVNAKDADKSPRKSKMQSTHFDPNGSYTGTPYSPENFYERPVQDADDL